MKQVMKQVGVEKTSDGLSCAGGEKDKPKECANNEQNNAVEREQGSDTLVKALDQHNLLKKEKKDKYIIICQEFYEWFANTEIITDGRTCDCELVIHKRVLSKFVEVFGEVEK